MPVVDVINVALGERSYPIFIGANTLADGERWTSYIKGNDVVIISNNIVAPLYEDAVRTALGEDYRVYGIYIADGEANKNMISYSIILEQMIKQRFSRSLTVIALGGGVIGDIAGFAAASFMRGVNFIQMPTSLLAQVDSSVGGKTGINHGGGKNLVGAFYQPKCVVIDTSVLVTLPKREFNAGMAEVIKYGLIRDADFFNWIESNVEVIKNKDEAALRHIIMTSCAIKADVVSEDEREGGVRAILNLGHTFGHALEAITQYKTFVHGEAIAIGMVTAAQYSCDLGHINQAVVERIKNLFRAFELPIEPPQHYEYKELVSLMQVDKKVINGMIRLVLLRNLGEAFIMELDDNNALKSVLAKCNYIA